MLCHEVLSVWGRADWDPKFSVNFFLFNLKTCFLKACNHVLSHDKKFMAKTFDIKIGLIQVLYFKGSWSLYFWSVFTFWLTISWTIYLLMNKISSLRLMIWKLIFFSQKIWRSHIGPETGVFSHFLHFGDRHFTCLREKFQLYSTYFFF